MTDINEKFSTAMLILASTNDIADSELREAVNSLRKYQGLGRMARAHAENARTSSDDVMRRMQRFLTDKGVWQQYVDYMDRRQEQIDYSLTVLRMSIKQVLDTARSPNALIIAELCTASVLLHLATVTHRRLIIEMRKSHFDAAKILRGMSMHEACKFFSSAVRFTNIDSSYEAVKAVEDSEKVIQAEKALVAALNNTADMHEAEQYAFKMNNDNGKV